MGKRFYDFYYEVLSHYLNFPDVADTYKSIEDGYCYLEGYPKDDIDFLNKRADIICYILKIRGSNIIYKCQESNQLFLPIIPGFSNKTIYNADRMELRIQLEREISILSLKGIHQVIKHLYPALNDNMLSAELLQQGERTLQKYGIAVEGQHQWIN